MKEQFDRALRNHIRDTFDHYDDQMADDGWKKFKAKERSNRVVFWYAFPSGIAAALALLWLFKSDTITQTAPKTQVVAKMEMPASRGKVYQQDNAKAEIASIPKTAIVEKNSAYAKKPTLSTNTLGLNEREQLATIFVSQKELVHITSAKSLQQSPTFTSIAQSEKELAPENFLANAGPNFKEDLIVANQNTEADANKKTDNKKERRVNFAIDANTYYSFTNNGVSNNPNLGVGFASEVKLSKHFSISSGIAINKQTTSYASVTSANSEKSLAFAANKTQYLPSDIETEAKLVGLDIPVNLKYNVDLGKTKAFVSTGISSYSVLNQTYNNSMQVVNYSFTGEPSISTLRNVDEENDPAFSNFKFARTVNFSFGFLYPVSRKNTLAIEPFVKYPIAGFGKEDLEIGSGGLSLKFNFGK